MSVLGPSPKRIDQEERRLIDEAISAGKVTRYPTGVSAIQTEFKYNPDTGRILPIDPGVGGLQPMRFFGAGQARTKVAFDRRAKVKRMMGNMTQQQMADLLGVHLMTIRKDVAIIRGQTHDESV